MSRTAAKQYIFRMEITHVTPASNSKGNRIYVSMEFLFIFFQTPQAAYVIIPWESSPRLRNITVHPSLSFESELTL